MIETLEKKVDDGLELTQEEALWLAEEAPLEELCEAAHCITLKYASHKLICVPLSMPSRDGVPKIANGVLSRHIMQRVLRCTDWFRRRNVCAMQRRTKNRELLASRW